MANIVYNQFLKEVMKNNINLTLPDTYKIALLSGYPKSKTPSPEDSYNYHNHLINFECKDTGEYADEDYGYQKGGKYVQLRNVDTDRKDNNQEYTCDSVQWTHVTLDEDNAAKYVILYRDSDGLLISCHSLDYPIVMDDDTLKLTWYNVPVLSFAVDINPESLIIDSTFSDISTNALQNRVITGGLRDYGVIMADSDAIEEVPDVLKQKLDVIKVIPPESIPGMFD